MYQKKYCLGFIFDNDEKHVLLMLKKRGPVGVINKWNGIGGKVKRDETYYDAMKRKSIEEIGIDTTPFAWNNFGKICGSTFIVECFSLFVDKDLFSSIREKGDERIDFISLDPIHDSLKYYALASHVKTLIRAALDNSHSSYPKTTISYY